MGETEDGVKWVKGLEEEGGGANFLHAAGAIYELSNQFPCKAMEINPLPPTVQAAQT